MTSQQRTLERVVVLRVHREDPNDKNEAYFLGRPVQKAYQLGKDGPLAGKKHMQGEWVTAVKWYELEKILDRFFRVLHSLDIEEIIVGATNLGAALRGHKGTGSFAQPKSDFINAYCDVYWGGTLIHRTQTIKRK